MTWDIRRRSSGGLRLKGCADSVVKQIGVQGMARSSLSIRGLGRNRLRFQGLVRGGGTGSGVLEIV